MVSLFLVEQAMQYKEVLFIFFEIKKKLNYFLPDSMAFWLVHNIVSLIFFSFNVKVLGMPPVIVHSVPSLTYSYWQSPQ
jgi:hypothetical protein